MATDANEERNRQLADLGSERRFEITTAEDKDHDPFIKYNERDLEAFRESVQNEMRSRLRKENQAHLAKWSSFHETVDDAEKDLPDLMNGQSHRARLHFEMRNKGARITTTIQKMAPPQAPRAMLGYGQTTSAGRNAPSANHGPSTSRHKTKSLLDPAADHSSPPSRAVTGIQIRGRGTKIQRRPVRPPSHEYVGGLVDPSAWLEDARRKLSSQSEKSNKIEKEPVQPVQPVRPVQREEPVQTLQPVHPEEPVQTLQSVHPEEPVQTLQPVHPEEPVQTVQHVQPVESVHPKESVQTLQPVHPEEPVQTVQHVQPVESVHPKENVQTVRPVQSVQPVQPVQPEELTRPAQSVQSVQPIRPEQPTHSDSPTPSKHKSSTASQSAINFEQQVLRSNLPQPLTSNSRSHSQVRSQNGPEEDLLLAFDASPEKVQLGTRKTDTMPDAMDVDELSVVEDTSASTVQDNIFRWLQELGVINDTLADFDFANVNQKKALTERKDQLVAMLNAALSKKNENLLVTKQQQKKTEPAMSPLQKSVKAQPFVPLPKSVGLGASVRRPIGMEASKYAPSRRINVDEANDNSSVDYWQKTLPKRVTSKQSENEPLAVSGQKEVKHSPPSKTKAKSLYESRYAS